MRTTKMKKLTSGDIERFSDANRQRYLHNKAQTFNLRHHDMRYTVADRVFLRDVHMHGSNLSKCEWLFANLAYADLSYSKLVCSTIRCSDITGIILINAKLHRADLRGVHCQEGDLKYANLINADCTGSNFQDCSLRQTDMRRTIMQLSNLAGADCRQACMRFAILEHSILKNADCRHCDLRDANLVDIQIDSCNLIGACIDGARLGGNRLFDIEMDPQNLMTVYRANRIVPEAGEFKAWKKVDEHLVELTIPEDAERIGGLAGPKCRVSHAYVQSITEGIDYDPEDQTSGPIKSDYDPAVVYEVGHRVVPDEFDNRVDRDCTNGIHCFVEREHAINF